MSAPIMPDDRAVGTAERLHPLFLVTGLGRSLRGLAGGYAAIGYLAVSGRAQIAVLGAIVMLIGLAISVLVYWWRFEFRVGESEIRIDSGLLSRTHRSIPFDRIQDVDVAQGPLARLLGLARVKFETGGATQGGRDEGVLQAIPLARAEEIRRLIRISRASDGGATAASATLEPEQPPIYDMPLSRVLLAGVFNFSLAVFAGLIGLSQTFGDFMGFDPLNRRFWQDLVSAGSPLADSILAHRTAAAVAGLFLLLAVGLLTGIFRTLLREFGFRLDSTPVGLRRRRGLLTKTDVTLPALRAQAAILATGPVRDWFGWREVRLQSLASDEGGKGTHVVAPLATDDMAATILTNLGWRPLPEIAWERVSPAHVATLAIGLSPLVVAAAIEIFVLPPVAAALIGAWLIAVALRWLDWRRTAWALDGDRLLVRSGWWRRRTVILPIGKIQSIDLFESVFSRWFGIATLAFGVAGGSAFSAHRLIGLRRETARTLRQQLLT